MKIPKKTRKKARIEIIPMIDTMFFLLVFFMIATLSMTIQRGLNVNLPYAATAHDDFQKLITLTITKDRRLFFEKEEVYSLTEVEKRLSAQGKRAHGLSIVINADKNVEHGRVIEVMDIVRKSGITKIAVATRPKEFFVK
ncbi:MAG TPA: biopolymer transporter ExbD [Syntrophorhabdaceae bacterium]|nr:biopolymer transporter ExbD [Syntrophorhabdaceae bacterium]HPU29214.1 biopolymer transporter ExbD [Syntrophorhabdaceae bacterium]